MERVEEEGSVDDGSMLGLGDGDGLRRERRNSNDVPFQKRRDRSEREMSSSSPDLLDSPLLPLIPTFKCQKAERESSMSENRSSQQDSNRLGSFSKAKDMEDEKAALRGNRVPNLRARFPSLSSPPTNTFSSLKTLVGHLLGLLLRL